jgi:hypothetical protein
MVSSLFFGGPSAILDAGVVHMEVSYADIVFLIQSNSSWHLFSNARGFLFFDRFMCLLITVSWDIFLMAYPLWNSQLICLYFLSSKQFYDIDTYISYNIYDRTWNN